MISVYVLQGQFGKRYVGLTNDLDRRMKEHRSGNTMGGQLIGKFQLLHTEQFDNCPSARDREKYLKSGGGREWLNKMYPLTGSAFGG